MSPKIIPREPVYSSSMPNCLMINFGKTLITIKYEKKKIAIAPICRFHLSNICFNIILDDPKKRVLYEYAIIELQAGINVAINIYSLFFSQKRP